MNTHAFDLHQWVARRDQPERVGRVRLQYWRGGKPAYEVLLPGRIREEALEEELVKAETGPECLNEIH